MIRPGPIIKLSTDFDKKVKAAKKIKNKYLKKKIGQKNTQNKISKDWLKKAVYLDTKDQDKINCMFVPPKKIDQNKISGDAGHFLRTEIDSTDFKNENLVSKMKKSKKSKKTPYQKTVKIDDILDQDAQIEVKKLSEKYLQKFKLPGETGKVFNADINRLKASKKIKEKCKKIRQNKVKSGNIIEFNKVNKSLKDIDMVEEMKDISNKKRKQAAARVIIKKCKTIKKPKKTYLVEDIKEVPKQQEVKGESIIEAVNNVFDFRKFKKDQENILKKGITSRKITAEKISKKL